MKLTSQNGRGERGEVHGLWDKCRLVRLKEQWLLSSRRWWERGNTEKEERGSCWSVGLFGTDIIQASEEKSLYIPSGKETVYFQGLEKRLEKEGGKRVDMHLNVYIVLYILQVRVESRDTSSAARSKLAASSFDATNQRSQTQRLFRSPLFKESLISCPWISKLYINSTLLFSFTLLT